MRNLVIFVFMVALSNLNPANAFSISNSRVFHTVAASDSDVLAQTSNALGNIVKKTSPAVVSISAIKAKDQNSLEIDKFEESVDPSLLGIGSGIILKSDGIILTNNHVVDGAIRITVTIDEKHKLLARCIGGDPKTDLAVLQLLNKPKMALPTLVFGNSDELYPGDWTLAIGSPFGLSHSVTSGIVSAVGRAKLGVLDTEDFIQTDAAINPGNSGGPLLNSKGEVIGINTAIFSQSGGSLGIGFAIPSKIALEVFNELLDHGRVIRGWIGMTTQNLDEDMAKYFKIPSTRGALVTQILPGGPAAESQLQTGDVVTQLDSTEITDAEHLKRLVTGIKTFKSVKLSYYRSGAPGKTKLNIREQPSAHPGPILQQAGQIGLIREKHSLGFRAEDIPAAFTRLFNLSSNSGALITEIKPGSPAFDAGLNQGDIVLKANQNLIHNSRDLNDLTGALKSNEAEILYVQRGLEDHLFISLKAQN
jgi:serine protease Do